MTMFPSACIWAYRVPISKALREVKETSYHYVDVETEQFDAPEAIECLKSLGLKVACVALHHKLPRGCSLDTKDAEAARNAVLFMKKSLEKCRSLGAQAAYVAPCADRNSLRTYGTTLAELAADAEQKGIRFCIEHVPGSALPSAREALAFVEGIGHANMHLLLDVGHTILSREKPWEIVAAAGKRVGYVQLSDNDGRSDKHWPLLDGRLTLDDLQKTLEALELAGYKGTLGMELNHDRASLVSVFSRNRNLVLRLQATSEIKSLKEPESRRKL